MPHLWATQRVFKKVWSLSYLLSGIRISGQATRSCEIELVANNWLLASGYQLLVTGSWPEAKSEQPGARSQKQDTR